jgi:hypothetical protein
MRQAERAGDGNQGEAAFDEEHTANFMLSGGWCAPNCGVTQEGIWASRIRSNDDSGWTRQRISHICANNFLFRGNPAKLDAGKWSGRKPQQNELIEPISKSNVKMRYLRSAPLPNLNRVSVEDCGNVGECRVNAAGQ